MTVIIQGKEYSSVSECARQHNIDPKLLVSRIRCYGQNSNKLFKPVLPAKHSITYKGKKYETLKEFAEAFNLKPSTVHHRWERGIRDPELLKKTVNQSVKENINKFNGKYAHSVTYHGHIFPTLKAMASYYDVPYFRLTRRIARYGIDYPNLLSKQSLRNDKQIIYQDKKYNSIAELAQEFNISPSAFYSRLSSGYSISEALTHDFSRGNKVVFDGKTYPSHNALFKALATPDCSWFVIKQRWRKNIRNKSDLTRPKNTHSDKRTPSKKVNVRTKKEKVKTRREVRLYSDKVLSSKGLISSYRLAHQVGMPTELASSIMQDLIRGQIRHNGLKVSDIETNVRYTKEELENAPNGRTLPKYAFKKEAVDHIINNRNTLMQKNLILIPQTDGRYFWDAKSENVWSCRRGRGRAYYKMTPIKYGHLYKKTKFAFIIQDNRVFITTDAIKDLIKYPSIKTEDLLSIADTKAIIGNEINVPGQQGIKFDSAYKALPKIHYRYCNNGKWKKGWTKSEIRRAVEDFKKTYRPSTSIVLQGKRYDSIKQAADIHKINYKLLDSRINKYGHNSTKLFLNPQHNHKTTKLTIRHDESFTQIAREHNIKRSTLFSRVTRWESDSPRLFKNKKNYKVMLLGKTYISLSAAAKEHNIPVYILRKNISRFGKDDPKIFKRNPRREPIIIDGIAYPNIESISRKFNISSQTISKRIKERRRKGLPLDSSVLKPTINNGFTFKGKKYKSVSYFLANYPQAKGAQISRTTFMKRLEKFGEDREDILFMSVEEYRAQRFDSFFYKGIKYDNLNQCAKRFGIDPKTIERRLKILDQNDEHLMLDSKSYSEWLKTEEGHNAYIKRAAKMFPLRYKEKKYTSLEEMSHDNEINILSLSKRLVTQGTKSETLLKLANHTVHKELPIYKIDGHFFKTKKGYIKYVMNKTGYSYPVIYRRIQKYGIYDPRVFYSGKRRIKFIVKIDGKFYFNTGDIAEAFNLSEPIIRRRIKKYGLNDPDIILPISEFNRVKGLSMARLPQKINYHGHEFKSIRAMARYYGIDNAVLSRRIRIYGLNYKHLCSDPKTIPVHAKEGREIEYRGEKYASYADMASKNNLSVAQLKIRLRNNQSLDCSTIEVRQKTLTTIKSRKAHKSNLVTAEEVFNQTGYDLKRLKSILNKKSLTANSEYAGILNLNKFVKKTNNKGDSHYKYAFNPEIIPFINNHFEQIRQKHLIMVPQLREMYFWDAKNEEFYSLDPKNGNFHKKIKRRDKVTNRLGKTYFTQTYVQAQLIPGYKWQSRYYISEIKSLIEHPEVYAKDLVTITQIQNSHPEISKRNLTSTILAKYKVPFYRRHFSDGRTICGYLPQDVDKFFKRLKKDAKA